MKKIFTPLILLLLIVKFSLADSVDKKVAQQIAENFFSAQVSNKSTLYSVSNVKTFEYSGETTMYIFSFSPTGFVIVSADDNVFPILGYSETNSFNNGLSCPNVIYYFKNYSKQINQVKLQKIQNPEVKQQWDNYKSGKSAGIKGVTTHLLSTTWNQGTPSNHTYNLLCPGYSYTGCVATAMAQIMKFHNWPATGKGWHKFIPTKHPSYGIQYANFDSTTYDWANMPNELTSSSTTVEKNAIATLMYHVGISVDMDYDPTDGSGASSADVMYALTSYFKYDPTTIRLDTLNVNDQTAWFNLIKNEIDNNRPVFYSGSTEDKEGHAWVCEGYDASNNQLYMNWGWGGDANGCYPITAMSPSSVLTFNVHNSAITGIQPNTSTPNIQWVKQASAFTAASRAIENISAVNDRVAWAVAKDGSGNSAKVKDFTRTIDGGSTWVSGTINAPNTTGYSASMISAISEKKAWVALYGSSGGGKIVNTTDGGTTWTAQSTATFSAPAGFPNVVHFWDENNGFCMGDPNGGYFEIYTTIDGGTKWTRVPSTDINASAISGEYGTVGFYATYNDIVWFATTTGRIFKSTDRGYHWVVYQTPITDASFEISFKDENTGIIQRRGSTGTNLSYITTDGGQTWTQLNPIGNFYQSDFMFVPGSNLLISTGSDYSTPAMGVSYSTDNGTTFTDYADFYKNYQFLALGAASDKSIWAGGFNSSQYSDGMWHYGAIPISADFKVNSTTAHQNDLNVVFTDLSYGSPETWSWDFGQDASPATLTGEGPHTIKYTTTGNKTITLTITKGTEEQIYVKENYINVTWPVDVETTDLNKQFTVYPNPASTFITINGYERGTVKVYSSTGALVMDIERLNNGTLNISNLNSGLYIIRIQTPEGTVISKKLSISK